MFLTLVFFLLCLTNVPGTSQTYNNSFMKACNKRLGRLVGNLYDRIKLQTGQKNHCQKHWHFVSSFSILING
jgi:hypothetical protein